MLRKARKRRKKNIWRRAIVEELMGMYQGDRVIRVSTENLAGTLKELGWGPGSLSILY